MEMNELKGLLMTFTHNVHNYLPVIPDWSSNQPILPRNHEKSSSNASFWKLYKYTVKQGTIFWKGRGIKNSYSSQWSEPGFVKHRKIIVQPYLYQVKWSFLVYELIITWTWKVM